MSEVLQEAVDLMLMGMGTVFVFLALLVVGTSLMSALLRRLPAEPELKPAVAVASPGAQNQDIAAVAAAVKAYHDANSAK